LEFVVVDVVDGVAHDCYDDDDDVEHDGYVGDDDAAFDAVVNDAECENQREEVLEAFSF
jgi:hypothetical protein